MVADNQRRDPRLQTDKRQALDSGEPGVRIVSGRAFRGTPGWHASIDSLNAIEMALNRWVVVTWASFRLPCDGRQLHPIRRQVNRQTSSNSARLPSTSAKVNGPLMIKRVGGEIREGARIAKCFGSMLWLRLRAQPLPDSFTKSKPCISVRPNGQARA
ncbi:hypothetical protein VTK26DRAFT_4115 [Humicola hyalothermophila]